MNWLAILAAFVVGFYLGGLGMARVAYLDAARRGREANR